MNLPLHQKLGYDHMIEMRAIEAELRAAGVSGTALHFRAISAYEMRHRNDPSFRQRQEDARARGERWIASPSIETPDDLLRKALIDIRDGHNDPRALARLVLEAT